MRTELKAGDIEQLFTGAADGELDDSDLARLHAELDANPELKARFDQYQKAIGLLKGAPREKAPVALASTIMRRVRRRRTFDRRNMYWQQAMYRVPVEVVIPAAARRHGCGAVVLLGSLEVGPAQPGQPPGPEGNACSIPTSASSPTVKRNHGDSSGAQQRSACGRGAAGWDLELRRKGRKREQGQTPHTGGQSSPPLGGRSRQTSQPELPPQGHARELAHGEFASGTQRMTDRGRTYQYALMSGTHLPRNNELAAPEEAGHPSAASRLAAVTAVAGGVALLASLAVPITLFNLGTTLACEEGWYAWTDQPSGHVA